jgi:hypothetical protein
MPNFSPDFNKYFGEEATETIIYNLDTINKYRDLADFQAVINIERFLKRVTDATIKKDDPTVVLDNIAEENYRSLNLNVSQKPVWTSEQPGFVPNTAFQTADRDMIRLQYQTIDLDQASFNDILTKLRASIGNLSGNIDFSSNHVKANDYIETIVLAICQWKYSELKKAVKTAVSKGAANRQLLSPMTSAFTQVLDLMDMKEKNTLNSFMVASKSILTEATKRKRLDYFMVAGLNESGSDKIGNMAPFSAPINFKLRDAIYKKVVLREIKEKDDNTYKYAKRLLTEMYMIAFFPYIHLLYITEMLKRFNKVGDFINMRVAVLTKVMFAVNTLYAVYNKGKELMIQTDQSMYIKQLLDGLQKYAAKLSRVDFVNERLGLGDVLVELHEKSNQVVEQSQNVDELKAQIAQNQLEIRNLLSNVKSVDKEYRRRKIEFALVLTFLIVLVLASSTLITMNMFIDYLKYALAIIIGLILIVKVVMMIVSLL